MSPKANPFEMAVKAALKGAETATSKVASMVGVPEDADVANYTQLLPEDFDEMMSRFGEEPTLNYIRIMETKLQKQ